MGGLSIWHWIIVLVVVLLVFGTKRLRSAGKDLGEADTNVKKLYLDSRPDFYAEFEKWSQLSAQLLVRRR